jgi:hypothetical protein
VIHGSRVPIPTRMPPAIVSHALAGRVFGVVGSRLTDPMAAIVADDLIKCLSASKENRDPFSGGRGSRLSSLVELSGQFANRRLTPTTQELLDLAASLV